MQVAARAESPIERGLAGPGLLAYIVTSKFSDYLPLYRLEEIFARQGFEISRATQSVWCGDVADLVEPLYQRMAERVRASHVVATDDTVLPMLSVGKTQPARMWVYVGDAEHPYNVFDFTLRRGRDGPQEFLKNFTRGAAGRRLRRLQRGGGGQRHDPGRVLVACPKEGDRGREHRTGDRPPRRRLAARLVRAGTAGQGTFRRRSVYSGARRSLSPCWRNCARSCSAGRSNCCPSIPWRRPSTTSSASGPSLMFSAPMAPSPSTTTGASGR